MKISELQVAAEVCQADDKIELTKNRLVLQTNQYKYIYKRRKIVMKNQFASRLNLKDLYWDIGPLSLVQMYLETFSLLFISPIIPHNKPQLQI